MTPPEDRLCAPSRDPLPCPLCRSALIPAQTSHGLVWLCRRCRAGAATLPVLRQVAPKEFVNHLWQAALHDGRRSRLACPSCGQPFTTFAKGRVVMRPRLDVCTTCVWVWLGPEALASLPGAATPPPALPRPRARIEGPVQHDPTEARRVLGSLTAGVLADVLELKEP